MRFAPHIKKGGVVLDVASGYGRHARVLGNDGYSVVAVDVDTSGLEDLRDAPSFEIIAADLESAPWPFEDRLFDGIIVTNYLHRPHFPLLIAGLSAGGVLIIETFGGGNERLGRPRNADFLLAPGELLEAFAPYLHVVAYEHGEERTPRRAVRQRLCAVKGEGPYLLSGQ